MTEEEMIETGCPSKLGSNQTPPPPPVRPVKIGSCNYTRIIATDRPEFGANHVYEILGADTEMVLTRIHFQKGPIKEHGVNGVHHEDLIAIVMDSLKQFQKTKFACGENQTALMFLASALKALNRRTKSCQERGVEGTLNV